MRKLALLAIVLSANCSKSDSKEGAGRATSGEKAAKGGDVTAFITGNAPTVPSEVASLKFGMPKADALKAVSADSGYVPSKTNDKVSYQLDFDDDKLQKISVRADTEVEAALTKAWGAPIKTAKELFWFNAATGTRAYLPSYGGGKTVTFDAYEPAEKVVGEKFGDLSTVNGKLMLGATLDEAKAAYGERLCDIAEKGPELQKAYEAAEKDSLSRLQDVRRELRYCPALPRAAETSKPFGDQLRFGLDGRLASVFMQFDVGNSPELIKQLLALADKTYGGKPTEIKTQYGTDRYYYDPASKLRTKVIASEQSVSFEQSRYLPLTELIGGDKPGLSIEGAHMPVGTFAEIKADDPEHYRQRGELASLYYPPTELAYQHTEADLLFYSGDKKTYGYRVNLQYEKDKATGDKIMDLLKAKFGEPKPAKGGTETDTTYNFTKNGRKVAARRVNEQFQITVTK